ncbi:hypothetical protein IV203_010429 [Nitzschia inconspicua]|uniref:Uncharacterized protein n=1 Tax=Nitzschia inconspicua TaxID=303405 RepID=A0A9K3KX69_9STRA|nr:hypothetical protein IV203_010429 [Nitzschia inconspicua]
MHIVNIHLSDSSNAIDVYVEEQMQLFDSLRQKQHKQRQEMQQQRPANKLASHNDNHDLGPILHILELAGYDITNEHEIRRKSLPSWSSIMEAYGPPRILGLDTCQRFQDSVDPSLRNLGVAGLFNSGTNLLYGLLTANCNPPEDAHHYKSNILWQVPWGKHFPADQRATHRVKNRNTYRPPINFTLPVVTTRDPYTWMQSMCRQNYAARFDHSKLNCPNIVPYPEDIKAHPRMEDLVFHAEYVTRKVCECVGFEFKGNFHPVSEVQNQNHGIEQNATSQGLLRSIIRYGNITNRRAGYPQFQLDAARELLDGRLMKTFGYKYED